MQNNVIITVIAAQNFLAALSVAPGQESGIETCLIDHDCGPVGQVELVEEI